MMRVSINISGSLGHWCVSYIGCSQIGGIRHLGPPSQINFHCWHYRYTFGQVKKPSPPPFGRFSQSILKIRQKFSIIADLKLAHQTFIFKVFFILNMCLKPYYDSHVYFLSQQKLWIWLNDLYWHLQRHEFQLSTDFYSFFLVHYKNTRIGFPIKFCFV